MKTATDTLRESRAQAVARRQTQAAGLISFAQDIARHPRPATSDLVLDELAEAELATHLPYLDPAARRTALADLIARIDDATRFHTGATPAEDDPHDTALVNLEAAALRVLAQNDARVGR